MSVEVKTVEFVGSFTDISNAQSPPFPQIAFAGRSNVGKSSLINKLVGRKSIARVSSTPGKTRLLNYFLVNKKYLFVDLPGYGYAKASKEERRSWRPMVEGLLKDRRQMKAIIVLVDGRRGILQEEADLLKFAASLNLNSVIVFTKADKLNQSQRANWRNTYPECLFFSSVSGEGKMEVLQQVFGFLAS